MIFDNKKGFDDMKPLQPQERPMVAISSNIMDENSALHFAYSQAIIDAGGVPIIIPANSDVQTIDALVKMVDALVLSGGDDIDARYFGEENIEGLTTLNEERDYHEFLLLRVAENHSLPILGICRGSQVINIAHGGTLYQDLPSMYGADLVEHKVLSNKEMPVHEVKIKSGSMLHKIVGESSYWVNSRHHQANRDIAPDLISTAHSTDGVEEALEGYPAHKIIAVQWHPENMATAGASEPMKRLFEFIVSEANLYRRAKKIHQSYPIIDSHCDTPMLYDEGGFDFHVRNSKACVDLVKMTEGRLDATITVAYIPQNTPPAEAPKQAMATLWRFKEDIAKLSDRVVIAYSPQQVIEAKRHGLKSIMLGVENGLAIGDDLHNINRLKDEGVLYITLCHNGANHICDSAVGETIHNGLSSFGEKVVKRMNSLGVSIDISHASEKSVLNVLTKSRQPIIASHSSSRALCDHARNLSDSTIRAIGAKGGVVQVCGYEGFLRSDGKATIQDLVDHIEAVIDLIGYNHVGVGSDFDGGGGVVGFQGAHHFINLTVELLRRGHSRLNVAKIMGGNILRLLAHNFKD